MKWLPWFGKAGASPASLEAGATGFEASEAGPEPVAPETAAAPIDAELQALQGRLGYAFRRIELLEEALTHVSCRSTQPTIPTLERLEFLGDAVLGMVLAERLFQDFPGAAEGELTRYRSQLASGVHLSAVARRLEVGRVLRFSEAEARAGGADRASVLEDALEAILGAIYLDSDYPTARACLHRWLGDYQQLTQPITPTELPNPKGRLQELLQARYGHVTPTYTLLSEAGPAHQRSFRARVSFRGVVLGEGDGRSKKSAEESAARAALRAEAAVAEPVPEKPPAEPSSEALASPEELS